MAPKGTSCPNCGYVIGKWAVTCPKCRTDLGIARDDDVNAALVSAAARHLRNFKIAREGLKRA